MSLELPNSLSPALEEALVAKLSAETRDLEESIRIKNAEARKAEAYARSQEITLRASERSEKISLAGDHFAHVYNFVEPFTEFTVGNLLHQLSIWDRIDRECPMTIILNSPGGSVMDGLHAFDEIVNLSQRGGGGHHVTIKARGMAASMGSILLQAADTRVMGPEAFLMVHKVASLVGGRIDAIEDEVKLLNMISDRIAKVFVNRADGKTSLTAFKKLWNRTDAWLDSDEALKCGFVDRIG